MAAGHIASFNSLPAGLTDRLRATSLLASYDAADHKRSMSRKSYPDMDDASSYFGQCGTLVTLMRHLLATTPIALLLGCSLPAADQDNALPPLSGVAQSERYTAFQNAMERSPADGSVRWQVSNAVSGSVTPIDTVYSRTDGWCRSYEEIIADGAKRYRIVGIACRDAPQRWLVLDVRPLGDLR